MSSSVFIGIDPGATGAIATIDNCGTVIMLADWPGDEVAAAQFIKWIIDHTSNAKAAIEKVASMPKQGVSSTFKFGTNYGSWRGILAMAGISFELVPSRKWQKGLVLPSDGATPKERSLTVARRIFPTQITMLKRKKDNGRSDALLIAHWLKNNRS